MCLCLFPLWCWLLRVVRCSKQLYLTCLCCVCALAKPRPPVTSMMQLRNSRPPSPLRSSSPRFRRPRGTPPHSPGGRSGFSGGASSEDDSYNIDVTNRHLYYCRVKSVTGHDAGHSYRGSPTSTSTVFTPTPRRPASSSRSRPRRRPRRGRRQRPSSARPRRRRAPHQLSHNSAMEDQSPPLAPAPTPVAASYHVRPATAGPRLGRSHRTEETFSSETAFRCLPSDTSAAPFTVHSLPAPNVCSMTTAAIEHIRRRRRRRRTAC